MSNITCYAYTPIAISTYMDKVFCKTKDALLENLKPMLA